MSGGKKQLAPRGLGLRIPKFKNGDVSKETGRGYGRIWQRIDTLYPNGSGNFGLPRDYANERHEFSHINMDPLPLNSGVNDPFATQDDVLNDSREVSSPNTPMGVSQGLSSLDPSGPEQTDQNEVTPTNPILSNDYANTSTGISSQTDLDGALLNDAIDFDSFGTDLNLSMFDWKEYYSKKQFLS
ncbi:hypothetical protein DL769_003345 [Monosporascus sp. CRB-8-3]|nr:hypothetical protein DL769_003345 [Monosporascus sp. CRB-8-3]